MRTIWRACGIALLGAFGFGTAYAVAGSATAAIPTTTITLPTVSVPTLPTTTTVTVPTLPVTTTVTVPLPTTTTVVTPPPLPTTTAVTLPPPPPPPPAPRTTVSTPPSGGRPASPSPGTPAASLPTSRAASDSPSVAAPSSAGAESGEARPRFAETGRRSGPARLARLDLSRDRFVNRGKRRGSTVVRFWLSRPAKLVLVVRGPGPSCATVARIAFRGRAGANRFRFDGRIAGRPLEPGTYLLTPRLRGRQADLGRAYVTIVAPGAPNIARVLPDCRKAEPARPFLGGAAGTGAPVPPADDAAAAPRDVGVRSAESPPFPALPPPRVFDDPDALPAALGLAVLALLVVSLLGIAVEVVRQLRSAQH